MVIKRPRGDQGPSQNTCQNNPENPVRKHRNHNRRQTPSHSRDAQTHQDPQGAAQPKRIALAVQPQISPPDQRACPSHRMPDAAIQRVRPPQSPLDGQSHQHGSCKHQSPPQPNWVIREKPAARKSAAAAWGTVRGAKINPRAAPVWAMQNPKAP